MSIRLRLEHLVPEAIDALREVLRDGSHRERVNAAKEVLSWVYGDRETVQTVDIQLCAVAPEAITLDEIRAESERRRIESTSPSLVSDNGSIIGHQKHNAEQRKLRTSDDLFQAIADIRPDSEPQ
jgi:hypothetical protein